MNRQPHERKKAILVAMHYLAKRRPTAYRLSTRRYSPDKTKDRVYMTVTLMHRRQIIAPPGGPVMVHSVWEPWKEVSFCEPRK